MTHHEIEEPETTRSAHRLSPASPRPQNVPSPANIPILELQMDPNYDENSHNNGSATPAIQQYASQAQSQSQTPNLSASTLQFADPSTAANSSFQHGGTQGVAEGGAPGVYAQSAQYGASTGTQAQDNSSMNYSTQHQAHDASQTQAQTQTQAPVQSSQSAYPFAHNAGPAQSAPGAFQTEGNAGASVDVQALLDSMWNAQSQYAAPQMSPQSMQTQPTVSAASLPPRPPTQDQSANYTPGNDIRSFHPHSQQASNTQQRAGNGQLQPVNTRGQNYSSVSQGGAQSPRTPGNAQQPQQGLRSETPDDEDIRWPPEINRKYEDFLEQERKYVTEGQWDQFPMGSRLFIGNLPTEKVTKRDIFHRFYRHGALAQISIKQAYGFVQFLESPSCRRALDAEQGQAVRGRKMHLEISKPQKNSRKAEPQNAGARRRSRSPDYTRGGNTSTPRDGRYGGHPGPMSPRERDRRFRERDNFRPMRSPSPREMPRRMRSRSRERSRSRDRYDSRFRSRSRSPPRRRRSPSPRQDYTEDELDLRRRLPHEVPDIQILVLREGISRDFIRFAEDVFRQQGLRSNVLIMSGRFPEPAVVRRQIIEGVLAIVRMDTSGFIKGKVSVQIFDRRGGASNVQFNEYADLDPTTVAMLVNTAKQNQSQPVQSVQPLTPAFAFNGNMPPFNQPAPGQYPSAPGSQPNMSNMITSLDPATLSQLLGAMSANNAHQNQQPAPGFNADLARLLAQVSGPTQNPNFAPQSQQPAQPLPPQFSQFSGLASLFATQPQPQSQPQPQPQPPRTQPIAPPVQSASTAGAPPPDMSEIMAQLAKYQR